MPVSSPVESSLFASETIPDQETVSAAPWKILVVDDEDDIHNITRLVLRFFTFMDRPLLILDAYSSAEAAETMRRNPDIAMVLLDVVMETADAGLRFIHVLRDELGLKLPRIVLRTGQPGYAPESEVVRRYDINDYHTKTELTVSRLITVITAGLRAYDSLKTIEEMRRELEYKVAERTRELEASNALKDHVLAVIAHDLRGPVGNLKGFMDLLTATGQDEAADLDGELLEIMRDNANATLNLLDNLLFWARFQQNSLVQDTRDQDLVPVIQEVLTLWSVTARKKGIQLGYRGPGHALSRFDRTMISLVVRNLVGNSLKFTNKDGAVDIVLEEQGGDWRLSVRDTGLGLDSQLLEHLRSGMFIQSSAGTENEKGSGLGLMLCSDFVVQHGSPLTIDSQAGKGSSFSFSLKKLP
jgi:signal transduction histidine kinase